MQNEEKTANYIGEAVILLTADHLGIETEMLDTAKEVWRTKRLPDASLLGYYESLEHPRTLRSAPLVRTSGELLPRKRHRRE